MKQDKNNNILNTYLKSKTNLTETDIADLKTKLNVFSLFELTEMFLEYVAPKYINKNNIKMILETISETIFLKLDTLSLIKVIDLYIMFFNEMLLSEDILAASKNVLSVMSFELSNESIIEKEIKKRNITREKYVAACKKELEDYTNSIELNEKRHEYLDNMQSKILAYLEMKITTLEGQTYKYLLENLNTRFETISKKVLEISECFNNKSKLIKYDIGDILDYNNLKNKLVIYESFRTSLLTKNDNQE